MATEADTCRKFVVPRLRQVGCGTRARGDYGNPGACKRLQAETAAELDALLPAILDKAFKGEI